MSISTNDILARAKSGSFESFGLKKLEVRDDYQFGENFPTEAFAVRGPNSERINRWSDSLMKSWNQGDVDVESFIRENSGSIIARHTNEDLPGFVDSETISFDLAQTDIFRASVKLGYN